MSSHFGGLRRDQQTPVGSSRRASSSDLPGGHEQPPFSLNLTTSLSVSAYYQGPKHFCFAESCHLAPSQLLLHTISQSGAPDPSPIYSQVQQTLCIRPFPRPARSNCKREITSSIYKFQVFNNGLRMVQPTYSPTGCYPFVGALLIRGVPPITWGEKWLDMEEESIRCLKHKMKATKPLSGASSSLQQNLQEAGPLSAVSLKKLSPCRNLLIK